MSSRTDHSEATVVWRGKMQVLLYLVSVFGLFGQYRLTPLPHPDVESVHPTKPAQNDLSLATKYLEQYFSFKADPMGRRRRSRPSFSYKLKDMQSFFGLNRTGTLNPETLAVIRTPRCGVSDVEDYSHRRGNRWKRNLITYGVGRYTSHLPVNTVDSLIASALDVWAKASPLSFQRSYSHQADIMVEFFRNDHGDSFPFDGPDGTLAHAYGPGEGIGGDVHFDEAEAWTAGPKGFNLYIVAAHEFGHALGLKHSQNPESVMYPTYKQRKTHNLLSSEDIVNINTLYAALVKLMDQIDHLHFLDQIQAHIDKVVKTILAPVSIALGLRSFIYGKERHNSASLLEVFGQSHALDSWPIRAHHAFQNDELCTKLMRFREAGYRGATVMYGPRNKSPSPSSRFNWNNPSNPWNSGSFFPVSLKEICNPDLTFDAVTTVGEALFFFRDKYLWIKHNNQNDIKEGPISNFMPNIDRQIDAAYWVPQRATAYLFNGTIFWTVKGSQVKGRARNIKSFGFPSWVQQIDAAVHIHRTAHTLFFTQHLYWRYNEHFKSMNDSSPRNISEDFPGINGPISAAIYKDGSLHFFVGSEVYKYDIKQKEIIGAEKTTSWFGC